MCTLPSPLDPETEHKIKRMTLLVGLVGSDGIVLAADKCLIAPAQLETDIDERMGGRKIEYLDKHKVAYAYAGDKRALELADGLAARLDNGFDYGNIRRSLELVAKDVMSAVPAGYERLATRSLFVVFHGMPEIQLWNLRVTSNSPSASRVDGIAVAGASGNSARFFEHYYRYGLPIEKLKPLAATIILAGHEIDPHIIEGLDLAIFDKDGLHWIAESEKNRLRAGWMAIDDSIRTYVGA